MEKSNPEEGLIIKGSIANVDKISQEVNNMLGYEKKNVISPTTQEQSTILPSFIEKPVITETQSRQQIEDEKARKILEEERARQAELDRIAAEEAKRQEAARIAAEEAKRQEAARIAEQQTRNVIARETVPTPTTTITPRPAVVSNGNTYPYGQCTWYAASKRAVPNWGNAGQWYGNAQASGWAVGKAPRAGAIMVTAESSYGHVAYVESVNGGNITVSEMNYAGWGVISSRTIPANSGFIIGFIY